MIHNEHNIPLPVLGDVALRSPSKETSASMRSIYGVGNFTSTCELFSIIGDILSTLYCNNGALMAPAADKLQHAQILSQVMALNGRLEAYFTTMPDSFRIFIEGSEETETIEISNPTLVARQAISCRYRLHCVTIMLCQITDTRTQILVREASSSASGNTYASGLSEPRREGSDTVLS